MFSANKLEIIKGVEIFWENCPEEVCLYHCTGDSALGLFRECRGERFIEGGVARSFRSSEAGETMGSTGRLVAVCLSKRRHEPKKNVQRGYIKKGVGLVGDSHAGTEKEVSLLATEAIQALCQRTGIVAGPGSFAENITTGISE